MEYRNNEQEQGYSLYTEKIVPSPRVKYKRLIKTVKFLVLIVAIGIIYVLSDKVIIPTIRDKIILRNQAVDHIEFTRDEYPDPDTVEQQEDDGHGQIKRDYDAIVQSLRSKIDDVQKTVVIVKEYSSDEVPDYNNINSKNNSNDNEGGTVKDNNINSDATQDSTQTYQQSIQNNTDGGIENISGGIDNNSTVGLIVGHLNGRYMILTSHSYTDSVENYAVIVQETNAYKAELVCSDELTGISIISVEDSQVAEADRQYMKVAMLDNSYMINKGDMVIATGKIYGTSGAVDYGTITNRTIVNSVDNNYEIFETNLSCQKEDYGFLFNSDGNVIGISQENSDTKLRALGISDLKCMIECMINRQGKMYFGIIAQNVDSELSDKNGIPMGIYISKVDKDSPAYIAGLQPGDIIQGINKMPCYSIQRLNDKIYDSAAGQVLNVSIKRKGKSGYFDVSYDVSVELK